MKRAIALAMILVAACAKAESERQQQERQITAAEELTALYSKSVLVPWGVEAVAAGVDCKVLFVHVAVIMDDRMVEALHYGGGRYSVTPDGLERFYREHGFRGIAYEDDGRRQWVSGDMRRAEKDEPHDFGVGVHQLKTDDLTLGRISICDRWWEKKAAEAMR